MKEQIKELMRAGHPMKKAIAMTLSKKRHNAMMMAKGGPVLPDHEMFHEMQEDTQFPTMEPDMTGPNKVESMGQEESDARDIVDQGTDPGPDKPKNIDHGSPAHKMSNSMPLSEEILSILKRRKQKYE